MCLPYSATRLRYSPSTMSMMPQWLFWVCVVVQNLSSSSQSLQGGRRGGSHALLSSTCMCCTAAAVEGDHCLCACFRAADLWFTCNTARTSQHQMLPKLSTKPSFASDNLFWGKSSASKTCSLFLYKDLLSTNYCSRFIDTH